MFCYKSRCNQKKKKGGTNVNKLTPKFFSVTIEAKPVDKVLQISLGAVFTLTMATYNYGYNALFSKSSRAYLC